MLIPFGTDAPIYYKPIGTIVLIVANVFGFMFQLANSDLYVVDHQAINQEYADHKYIDAALPARFAAVEFAIQDEFTMTEEEIRELLEEFQGTKFMARPGWWPYALSTGDGLHPIQWFTAFFMHADAMHLIGNLIFLWAFGLVVEGRLGIVKFLIFYVVVGVLQNMLIQVIFLPFEGPVALGASGAIYGLMAAAMLWSPKDNLICLFIFMVSVFFPRIPILLFAAFYVLWDLGFMLLGGLTLSTPLLHVAGATVGLLGAFIALKRNWIDCEYQDFVSMALDAAGKDPEKLAQQKQAAQKEKRLKSENTAVQSRLRTENRNREQLMQAAAQQLKAQNTDAAIEALMLARRIDANSFWSEPQLVALISQLQKLKKWDQVIKYSESYLDRYKKHADPIKLNLAKLLLAKKNLPNKVLKLTNQLSESRILSAEQLKIVRSMADKAKKMIDNQDSFS